MRRRVGGPIVEMWLHDLIVRSARSALPLQRPDGSMPPGVNGPWGQPQTPVRTTGHWLVAFEAAYERTRDAAFRGAAERACDYLLSGEARPHGKSFFHRHHARNKCNGPIGQAWTLEALSWAAAKLGRDEARQVCLDLFLLHPFDRRLGLWHSVEIDGTVLPPIRAINQHVWFAAMGATLFPREKAVMERVRLFMEGLDHHLAVSPEGWASHHRTRTLHGYLRAKVVGPRAAPLRERSIGYQTFQLYGLGLLREAVPNHSIWASPKLAGAARHVNSAEFQAALEGNRYAYVYNPTGIEAAYVNSVWPDAEATRTASGWLEEQFRRTLDPQTFLMDRNTPYPETLAARIYEAVRLPDAKVSVPERLATV